MTKKFLYNGRIYTENPDLPWADSLVIEGKRISAVGTEEECRQLIDEDTELIDLGGRLVLPGLIDGHTHPATVSKTFWSVRAEELTKDKDQLLADIRHFAQLYPKEERPYFYYEGYFAETFGEEGPHKEDLDAIISDRPARIQEFGDHACWYNSLALEMLTGEDGKPHSTSPIGEPEFIQDENGRYTGLCLESIVDGDEGIFDAIGWQPPTIMNDEITTPFLDYLKQNGITCLMDGFTEGEENLKYIHELDLAGRLGLYYEAVSILEEVDDLDEAIATVRRWQDKYTTDHIRCNTIKFFIDGTNELGDCLSTQPFANRPGEEYYGSAYATREEMCRVLVRLNEEKIDFHVHTICDGAFRLMCDAVEDAQRICGDGWCIKVCLAHCEIIAPEDRDRIHRLGMYIDWSTHWAGGYFGEEAQTYLGLERWKTMYDFTTPIAAGEHVGFSSDVFSYSEADRANPFFGMQTSMTRVDPQLPLDPLRYPGSVRPPESAKLTLEQLIHGYTVTNAIRLRLDDRLGSIEAGKIANLVVMDDNIFDMAPDRLMHARVNHTWFDGERRDIHTDVIGY